jgi:hypothetical protein
VLGLWLAVNNGLEVPVAAIERACGWLLRTQDPSGAWGYQGEDPGHFQRVPQTEIRPALCAAGLGSMYICDDLLQITRSGRDKDEKGLPPALRKVGDPIKGSAKGSDKLDPKIVRKSLTDGNYWFTRHYTLESESFTHYYLYAFERYQSFREYAEGRSDSNPQWYRDVAAMLQKTQNQDGSWYGGDTTHVATSFAILTLLRSAKKTLAVVAPPLGEGVLQGGMGLPKKTENLQERDGKLVEEVLAGSIEELVTTIEKATPPELERLVESPGRWKLDNDVIKRSGEIVKLRSLVASGPPEARLATVRALARIRELDNVPLLIFAMSDSEVQIVREADKGLRFISRKFEGVGLPDEPTPADIQAAIAAWKAWYRAIRPTAELLD